MKQEELADRLQSKFISRDQRVLVVSLPSSFKLTWTPYLCIKSHLSAGYQLNELKKIQTVLTSDYPECLESQREDEEVLDGEDEEQRRSSRGAFLNIALHFLRSMKQEELADRLQSSKRI
ncbi:hypothetical protein F7725_025756 [Dissostichus mawsoni]|uniref:Uncharacterized protein n=1 Tax=Dissostichus mawsoni TaxID=36200 RepID=A0A7J5X557_DISMA|nr:hypothetical protein F7725_025756 [Dissostichus mawsoni]